MAKKDDLDIEALGREVGRLSDELREVSSETPKLSAAGFVRIIEQHGGKRAEAAKILASEEPLLAMPRRVLERIIVGPECVSPFFGTALLYYLRDVVALLAAMGCSNESFLLACVLAVEKRMPDSFGQHDGQSNPREKVAALKALSTRQDDHAPPPPPLN